ncbi:hypothetical protein HPB48_004722 [Haemaphysalis longicornis]|uniref:Uncharacterized protein n=1 Tax=Haemaphysalis longicornis TaxID=44386 RepID=A0A9J6G159_HAELO|nr:hypothetical protein HPB48_004722 [Haemaphysalis longicornis]
MGEASLGAKAPDLVSDSSASSSRGPPAEVVWPPHAYADVGMAVDYASGVPVSLHQQQHHYERQEFAASDRESALVVYHEEPYSQQQPSSGTPVETYIQAPVPTSDSEQQLQHYDQEIEQRAADDMVAMSQVLDLAMASSSSRDSVVDISATLHHGHHTSHHLAARPSSASPSPPPSQSPTLLVLPGGAAEEPAAVAALRLESQLTVGPESAASLGLPMLLDKASLAASCSSSGAASSALSSLGGPSTSSGSRGGGAISLTAHFSQRYLLEQAQYLVADLASKDLLPSILQGPCSSGASSSSVVPSSPSPVACSSSSVHGLNFSLGAAAKAMLATQQQQHKFATGGALQHAGPSSAVGAAGSVSAMGASPERLEDEALEDDEAVLDSSSSAGHGALLEVHPTGTVPLYGNVFVTERGEVALVSSTGEDAEDLLEDVEQYHAANQVCHQNGAIHNYVSSSADLVDTSNSVEPGIHSTVDSTDSSEHVINTSEAYVDTSTDYGQQLDLSSTVEASTSSRGVQHSVLRMQGILARRLPELAASPSSSHSMTRAEVCSAGGVSAEELEELQGAPVSVSGGLHPDSTNSPRVVEMAASSPVHPGPLVSPSHSPGPSSGEGGASGQPADRSCASQYWCEDCNQFYDNECPRHKVQLIVDKPVLTRAWASLPASYLYVHKVSETADWRTK